MVLIAYLATGVLSFIPGIKYVAWLAPLVIFIMEKQSSFVRFHAMQAFIINAVNFVISILIGGIIGAGFAAALAKATLEGDGNAILAAGAAGLAVATIFTIISLIFAVFALIALINGYQYKLYKIPLIGNLAEKFSASKA